MRELNLDRGWSFFNKRVHMSPDAKSERIVDLPHDYMIETESFPECVTGAAGGFYTAGVAYYEKKFTVPAEWKDEEIFLRFDGIMMNATVEVNGAKAALQHGGYFPFDVDITKLVYFGEENRVFITVNPSMQPNSRWYSGAGIFRSVSLVHTPALHLVKDGIYGITEKIVYGADGQAETAFLKLQAEVKNETRDDKIAELVFELLKDGSEEVLVSRTMRIEVNAFSTECGFLRMTVDEPALWSAETPTLYNIRVRVRDCGVFRAHFEEAETVTEDADCVLFGIRTVSADPRNGLQVNGKTVKLAGGCIHHDNGVIGAVSLYDAEYRKLSLLKKNGFNAVRTTHNPPSAALVEACDRLGVYIFDEAFDAWSIGKQPGDYNQVFDTDWQKDVTAFVKRDRSHPAVIIWSTGNEITERGGLGNGYVLQKRIADLFRSLDASRPVAAGICSFWSGLDDHLMQEMRKRMSGNMMQNADAGKEDLSFEELTEAFTNGLDIVGYNYMEDHYDRAHRLHPDWVILGSENFPVEIGTRWPMVLETPYVIGDFTWTAWDYIGEAGIGKAMFFEPDDPLLQDPMKLMGASHNSRYPWRTANDADFDICGNILAQGDYRRIVYGCSDTALYSYDPALYGKKQVITRWGFPGLQACWNYEGKEGQPVRLVVYSRGEEVELIQNGRSLGRVKQDEKRDEDLPLSFAFDAVYEPGEITAVSYANGEEISRASLKTAGKPVKIALYPEKDCVKADGHALAYVRVEVQDENGLCVPNAAVKLQAVSETGSFLGFGSGDPCATENYTSGNFTSFRGRALAVLRAGYEAGELKLRVSAEGFAAAEVTIEAK